MTLSDGTAALVICPLNAFYGTYALNASYLPFATVPTVSSTNPFAAAPFYSPAGPFNAQASSVVNFAIDSCTVDFI